MVSPVRKGGVSNKQSYISQTPENSPTRAAKIDLTLSSASGGSGDGINSLGLERKNLFGSDAEQSWVVAPRTSGKTQKVKVNIGGLPNEQTRGEYFHDLSDDEDEEEVYNGSNDKSYKDVEEYTEKKKEGKDFIITEGDADM